MKSSLFALHSVFCPYNCPNARTKNVCALMMRPATAAGEDKTIRDFAEYTYKVYQ